MRDSTIHIKRIARLSLGVCCVLGAAGCMRWQYANPQPAPGDAPATFDAVRVTAVNGGTQVLRDVAVTADSVIGWRGEPAGERQRVALHRGEVRALDRREIDPLRTAGATVLTAAAAYVALVVYLFSQMDW